MQVYMVMGTTGEYDSRSSWMVKAYVLKDLAEHHAKRAQKRADEIIMKALNGKNTARPWDADFDLCDDVMEQEKNAFDLTMKALNGKKPARPWDADLDLWDDVMEQEKNAFDPKFHCDFGTQSVGYYVAHTPIEVDTTV